jgi:hypothetical protein
MKASTGGFPINVHVCGIDISETLFHLVGLSKEGHIVTRKHFSRKHLLTYTVNIPTCLVGIEAFPAANFLARALVKHRHDLTTPGQYTVQAKKRIPKSNSVVESNNLTITIIP